MNALELRMRDNFRTPITPMQPGELWCMFDQRGTWEILVHPADATFYAKHGIVVDSIRYSVEQVDAYPYLDGILLRLQNPDRLEQLTFVAAHAA